jgi:hypothetical protein
MIIATSLPTTPSPSPTGAVQLIFLKDSHTHIKYFVDTGAALSLFPFWSTLPSSGSKLTNANGKPIVSWKFVVKTLHFGKFIFKHNFLQANDTQAILGLDIPPPTWIQNRFLFRPLNQICLPSTRYRTCLPSQARRTFFPSPTPSNLHPQIPFLLPPETFPSQDSPSRHSSRLHKLPSHLSDFIPWMKSWGYLCAKCTYLYIRCECFSGSPISLTANCVHGVFNICELCVCISMNARSTNKGLAYCR